MNRGEDLRRGGSRWSLTAALVWFISTLAWLDRHSSHSSNSDFVTLQTTTTNAAVNGHLELTLPKGRRRFDANSTSNLEVYKFQDLWIFTYLIFGHGESSMNNFWSMVNLERAWVLLCFIIMFYYFLYLKVNLDLEKNESAWWIFTQLYFRVGESWLNYFWKELNWWWNLT